ncbi:MAG: nuclear transport factor 2 family protein [Candidatus Hydrogenedens sp.]|nr:nuclear transport factor 2 family protein [Candidatus Hydrogenedens sp.]
MSEPNDWDFCERWLAAWTGNQPETLLGFYTEGAYYADPARPDGLQGAEALRKYFSRLLAANPEWRWEPVEVMPTAKGFTLKWKATIPAGAATVTTHGLDIVELDGGRISRNEVYFDASVLKAG